MDDLISRSALIMDFCEHPDYSASMFKKIRRKIMSAPAVDAVKVVYCKDCKWLYDEMDDYCCRSHRGLVRICENSYCSYGERKIDA